MAAKSAFLSGEQPEGLDKIASVVRDSSDDFQRDVVLFMDRLYEPCENIVITSSLDSTDCQAIRLSLHVVSNPMDSHPQKAFSEAWLTVENFSPRIPLGFNRGT